MFNLESPLRICLFSKLAFFYPHLSLLIVPWNYFTKFIASIPFRLNRLLRKEGTSRRRPPMANGQSGNVALEK